MNCEIRASRGHARGKIISDLVVPCGGPAWTMIIPPQSNRERQIRIPNPYSPKIPSHLFLMLIFIPNRFQTEKGDVHVDISRLPPG